MQAVIRTVGGELAQAAAEGMMNVDLRRAEQELERLSLDLTEARIALEGYEELKREAEGLKKANAQLTVQVEMLRYQQSKYVAEKLERLNEIASRNSTPPVWVRLWAGLYMVWCMICGKER